MYITGFIQDLYITLFLEVVRLPALSLIAGSGGVGHPALSLIVGSGGVSHPALSLIAGCGVGIPTFFLITSFGHEPVLRSVRHVSVIVVIY